MTLLYLELHALKFVKNNDMLKYFEYFLLFSWFSLNIGFADKFTLSINAFLLSTHVYITKYIVILHDWSRRFYSTYFVELLFIPLEDSNGFGGQRAAKATFLGTGSVGTRKTEKSKKVVQNFGNINQRC